MHVFILYYSIAIRNKIIYLYKDNNNQYSYMSNYVTSILYLQIEPFKS